VSDSERSLASRRLVWSDRQRSLGAGLVGAISALIAGWLVVALAASFQNQGLRWLEVGQLLLRNRPDPVLATIVFISGFLFGVTYRYATALRPKDRQLQAGVVLAFGLVRGLALAEPLAIALPWSQLPDLILHPEQAEVMIWLSRISPIGLCLVESLAPFAFAGMVLSGWGRSFLLNADRQTNQV